jgi:hypothetical protein
VPFTGSHPAAVVPLIRLGLVPSALVIGSMTPDLPYFLPLGIDSASTHSGAGILGVDLILGLLSFAVWQVLVAPLAVAIAPSGLRARLPTPRPAPSWRPGEPGRRAHPSGPSHPRRLADPGRDLRRLLLVMVSLWAGAATHVLWDEFTHINRFGYRHLGWLADQHGPLAGYRWAQYGSGVFGAVVIALAIRSWWRAAPVIDPTPEPGMPPRASLVVLVSVLLATLGGAGSAIAWAVLRDLGVRRALFLIATWGGGAGLVTLLVCAVLFRSIPTRPQLNSPPQPS